MDGICKCLAPKPEVVVTAAAAEPVTAAETPAKPVAEPPKTEAVVQEAPKPAPPAPTAAPAKGSAKLTTDSILNMEPRAVMDTMSNPDYQSDTELMGAACKQLRVLCRQDEHCKLCDQLEAAKWIEKTMSIHRKVPAVQQQACAALINLCAGESFERRDHAASSGALAAIVKAMEEHIEYPGIQEMAFVAIQNITFGQDVNGNDRKERAVEAGALKAIVEAVKKYEDTSSVLDQGAATLRLLCNKNNLMKAKAMEVGAKKDWLKSSGGVSARIGGLTSRMLGGKGNSPAK